MTITGEDEAMSGSEEMGNEHEKEEEEDEESTYSRSLSPMAEQEAGFNIPSHEIMATLPKELELRPTKSKGKSKSESVCGPMSVSGGDLSVSLWSRTDIKAFTRFGPYQAKIRKDPVPTTFNWKVSK